MRWLRRGRVMVAPPLDPRTKLDPRTDREEAEAAAWVMRRCYRCDVAWAGDQPCWMCGRPVNFPLGVWPRAAETPHQTGTELAQWDSNAIARPPGSPKPDGLLPPQLTQQTEGPQWSLSTGSRLKHPGLRTAATKRVS